MNQSERLKEIFIKNENKGIAIAITGSWGVGKTFFWNEFRESYKLKNKYVYVSLFGLESLSDLKTHIYSNIENNHSALEVPRWIRGLPSILKDTRISQFGISASAKVFDSLMFNQVKDAVICFDDFERMSNKLDIKDVMGLANQLKLEKNCQIILILDEDKAEGENKKKYAEYKEKLVDEEIKITSVEPLIRENTKDIDNSLVDLMVKFADELEIHNFRFFQKVIKLYKAFRKQLPEEVADSTKEIILIQILRGYLIEDFGNTYGISWELVSFESALERAFSNENIPEILQKLLNISYHFDNTSDRWSMHFRGWFEQRKSEDIIELHNLANSELISEKHNLIKEELNSLMNQWRNLDIDQSYCDRLFLKSSDSITFNSLASLDFHCFLLKKLGRNDLSKKLKREIKEYLVRSLEADIDSVNDEVNDVSDIENNLFCRYVRFWRHRNQHIDLSALSEVLLTFIRHNTLVKNAKKSFLEASQQDWENLIWSRISDDSELNSITKINLLRGILKLAQRETILPEIQKIIRITLENKSTASVDISQQKNIEFVINILGEEELL